jgi:hypothetical protein
MKKYKFVVHCPIDSGDKIRKAIGEAGGGEIGDYKFCSFTVIGTGRSLGGEGTDPVYGEKGELSPAKEERIEVTVPEDKLKDVVGAVLKVHPYDEPTYDIYPLIDL